MGVERLIQHDDARILQQHAGKQHALHLPTGQRPNRAIFESAQAHGSQRFPDTKLLVPAEPAENALGGARDPAPTKS